ncbi:GNAT family N-acetyltransferase [Vibrio hepatarius]|nr:GNAT family N-acetyltransferase [Vibrio hepatarius]
MSITTRPANEQDFSFLFELKKAAEYDAIEAVFGWDEQLQMSIHQQEWQQARPVIILNDGEAVGSYLFQDQAEHCYFGRFFLLPKTQGKGIGSKTLHTVVAQAEFKQKPIKLVHLQGNRVHSLYQRFGFIISAQDEHFVYMQKAVSQSEPNQPQSLFHDYNSSSNASSSSNEVLLISY